MLRRSGFILAAVVMAIGIALPVSAAETGGKLDDCIFVDIGDALANPGQDVRVPIRVSNVSGWGVLAFDMEICWCELPAGLLQYVGCQPGVVMAASGWSNLTCGACGPSCISVTSASAYPLEGEGILFSLTFHVSANAKPCMCCPLRFEHVYLYDHF